MKPTKHKFTLLQQVMDIIPKHLVKKLSRKHKVDKKCRTFSSWSHVVSLVFSQLTHALSLNDICDTLGNHSGVLKTIRSATPPSRNGLSYANRERNSDMAEDLFWSVLSSLSTQHPSFGMGRNYCGFPKRFKRIINVVDSTTIQLVANCIDWAKHRRRKAAAKCHMRLDLQTFLPKFAIVKAANSHDDIEARALCADIRDGEIVVFDKAYVDYKHLNDLNKRGVFWVTRAKTNMAYKSMGQHAELKTKILSDKLIKLTGGKSYSSYKETFRRISATVKVDGKDTEMVFITNNKDWSATSIADLYKARWGVEVFFKQLKQTLQLADFLGHNANAVRWQIWTALLTYVILRFIAYKSKWKGSFARLFTLLRGTLWSRLDMYSVIEICGGNAPPRMCTLPEQLYMPGFG